MGLLDEKMRGVLSAYVRICAMFPTPMKSASQPQISRRSFLRGGALGAAAASTLGLRPAEALAGHEGTYSKTSPPPAGFDFTKGSGALQADKIVDSACQFCNSNCRLKVHLKDGRIIDVLGEEADPVQAGGLCVKAEMMTQLVYNRFRLTKPLKRVAGDKGSSESKFEPCSWDEALEIIAKKFLALRDAGDAKAIANKTSGRLQRYQLGHWTLFHLARITQRHGCRPRLQ